MILTTLRYYISIQITIIGTMVLKYQEKLFLKAELSTALMMFYAADGDRYLQDKDENNGNLKEWSIFIKELYNRIINNEFLKGDIKFVPPLSKVQIFKLKKIISDEESVFLEELGSYDLNITL